METENLICATQEQAIRVTSVKIGIDHQNVSPLYSLCKEKVENVTHIASSCLYQQKTNTKKSMANLVKRYTGFYA